MAKGKGHLSPVEGSRREGRSLAWVPGAPWDPGADSCRLLDFPQPLPSARPFSLCCKRTDTSGSTASCMCGTQVSLGAPPACACKRGQINIKDSFLWLQYPCGTFRILQLSSGPSASPRHTLQSISACGSTACQPQPPSRILPTFLSCSSSSLHEAS